MFVYIIFEENYENSTIHNVYLDESLANDIAEAMNQRGIGGHFEVVKKEAEFNVEEYLASISSGERSELIRKYCNDCGEERPCYCECD